MSEKKPERAYPVQSPIRKGGQVYKPGRTIRLTDDEAYEMYALGAIGEPIPEPEPVAGTKPEPEPPAPKAEAAPETVSSVETKAEPETVPPAEIKPASAKGK